MNEVRVGFLLALAFLLCASGLWADETWIPPEEMDDDVLDAVARAHKFLARVQTEEGAWRCKVGYKLNNSYRSFDELRRESNHVGVTALACMSFMAAGHLPGSISDGTSSRGTYGKNVRRGLDWILEECVDSSGYISYGYSRMYSHGFAMLFLAEVYGMDPDPEIKRVLQRAVYLLEEGQNSQGGWRYQPLTPDADISLTVTQLQALRAARNAGIHVSKKTIERAIQYVKNSQKPSGAFKYQIETQTRDSFALTAAGVVALMSTGEYSGPEIQMGLSHMEGRMPRAPSTGNHPFHYFYGHYYASQCYFQAGRRYWGEYWPRLRREILGSGFRGPYSFRGAHPDNNVRDGEMAWQDAVGPTYATAMASLILQVPARYLPIFQK